MNRKEIKEKAKNMMRGKLWDIWKGFLFAMIPMFIVNIIFKESEGDVNLIISVFNLLFLPLSVGATGYILDFIRGKQYEVTKIWKYYKNFFPIIASAVMVAVLVLGGIILLIIPGIILGFAYSMVQYVLADGENKPMDVLKKSREMMKGYKMDYFIFSLSFLPWIILIVLTLGLAAIYVTPYIYVSTSIYYDELKKKYQTN